MGDKSSPTEGMVDYAVNSLPQKHSIQSRADDVREMADKVLASSDEIHIADYGCGTAYGTPLLLQRPQEFQMVSILFSRSVYRCNRRKHPNPREILV